MIMEDYMLLIDGSGLLSTQYYGNLPREVLMAKTQEDRERNFHKIMHTPGGVYTNGVYGFLRTLFKILETHPPKYLAVLWDLSRDTFRRELYPEYKANRGETPAPLKDQFALCEDVIGRIGIRQYMDNSFEADDFAGSLCQKFGKEIPIRILTKDHDYLQLVNDNVYVYLMQSSQTKADELLKKYGFDKNCCPEKCFLMTPETVTGEEGVKPASINHLKGLMGDSSDNIKGVAGIGPKTAVGLIAHYETVDALYDAIRNTSEEQLAEEFKAVGVRPGIVKTLTKDEDGVNAEESARLSTVLATIKTDIPIDEQLSDLELRLKTGEIDKVLHELAFSSLKAPAIEGAAPAAMELSYETVTVSDLNDADLIRSRLLTGRGQSYGIRYDASDGSLYLASADKVYRFIPDGFCLGEIYFSVLLNQLLADNVIYAFSVKELTALFPEERNGIYDLSVCDYLLRPLAGTHETQDLQRKYLSGIGFKPDGDYTAALARAVGHEIRKKIEDKQLQKLYEEIERPLIWVLADMEQTGIYADPDLLKKLDEEFIARCNEEEQTVYELAGMKFNLNSPKQLSEVLFEKLGLKGGKKTKNGYSTSADILEKLAEDEPVVAHILTYRQYRKLQTTYSAGLMNCIADDGRIHTTFQQTVTATGRLSSTNPNLQNIPIRTELGRSIRKVFLPKKGCVFYDADYSQIELRLMAHMSGDKSLIDAYNNAADIHRTTAAMVFHVPFEEVTDAQRSAAKAVNFGILYGISSFGLGQNLGIDRKTAESYIKSYYEKYPAMKQYLDENVQKAKESGEIRTLYGRPRPIPELSSDNFMQRSFGERIAMNSPIQGTAADIMKIAMVRVYRMLREQNLKAKMLVQVHDEILLEVPYDEEDKVKTILKEAMEGAAVLSVPLVANIHKGNSWYEAK